MFHYLMRVLVFENKLVSLNYFLDEMQLYEINTIISNIQYADRSNKELQRMNMYIIAQCNSKKHLKPQDIIKFKWDNEFENTGTKISDDEAAQIRLRAKQLEKMIENTTIVAIDNKEAIKLK